jgi:hypothetical protein
VFTEIRVIIALVAISADVAVNVFSKVQYDIRHRSKHRVSIAGDRRGNVESAVFIRQFATSTVNIKQFLCLTKHYDMRKGDLCIDACIFDLDTS